ncbi:MAG: kelch repeat-containing protein [Methylohalobius crimeensis]
MRYSPAIWLFVLCLFLSPWMKVSSADEVTALRNGVWRQVAPAPTPRTEVTAAVLDKKIYVIGGFSPLGLSNLLKLSVTDVVEVYDPAVDRWEKVPPLPESRHHAAAVSTGGRLFVFGGFAPSLTSVWNPVDTVFEYIPDESRWVRRRSMPTARGALAVALLDGKIFAIGGYDGHASLPVVEIYDPAADIWQSAPSLPTPRDHLAAAAVDGRVYAIGGRVDLDYKHNLGVTEVYDPAIRRWREVASLPTPRSGIAAVVLAGMVMVVGGEGAQGTFEENEAYQPDEDTWLTLPPLPTPRHGLAAVAVRDRLYALGGGRQPGGSYSKVNEVFVPAESK